MLSSGFGKRTKHKTFTYVPRFYDEEKEKLEETISRHKGDISDSDKVKSRISSGLRQRYIGDETYRKNHVKKSNVRILYILAVLILATYIILKSEGILRVLESFSQ